MSGCLAHPLGRLCADRLDAIGAIGVARTFTFSGAKRTLCVHTCAYLVTHILHFYISLAGPGTPLYDPLCPPRTTMTKEEYVSNPNGSTIKYYSNDAHENRTPTQLILFFSPVISMRSC